MSLDDPDSLVDKALSLKPSGKKSFVETLRYVGVGARGKASDFLQVTTQKSIS